MNEEGRTASDGDNEEEVVWGVQQAAAASTR